ncbi:hypothetical protein [Tunicatimonas pelagia]|uniref:hypothetical protein n=1 Tax=Tunicatimonas pelagia TaxID=931531 RepID=UPI002664E3BE|nr:hypothetical protein [Tunicatimonas pelagia]WKN41782.1 hypothetical protein P0M28_22345 [Tunicatimonas pelagia]
MRLVNLSVMFLVVGGILGACNNEGEESSVYTGRETQYNLLEGSYLETTTSGSITVRERTDKSVEIQLLMEGTLNGAIHPVHLHYGSLQDDGLVAEFLSNLEDAGNNRSQSLTHLTQLADGTTITYDQLIDMDGSIKVHFEEEGALKDVLLGATNIGTNYSMADVGSVKDITLCNSQTE